jgi:hypothetical protein
MSPVIRDVGRLGGRHYVGVMDRDRNRAFRIESERFEERR